MAGDGISPAQRTERVFQISVLLLVACGYLAIVSTGRLDLLSTVLVAAALILRLLHTLDVFPLEIPRPVASGLALGFVGFYLVELHYFAPSILQGFVPATLRLMFLFTALKLIIARKGRDYFYLGLLAFLQLLTSSMFMAGVGYLLLLLIFVFLAFATYTCFEIKRGCESGGQIVEDYQLSRRKRLGLRLAVLSTALAAGVLTLSVAFFLVLPRTFGESHLPRVQGDYSVGFSQEVDLGATGSLSQSHTPIMRVAPLSGDSLAGLKWRGLALRYFDGVRWSNPSPQTREVEAEKGIYAAPEMWRRSMAGRRIRYAVTLEPLSTKVLFVAGLPEEIRGAFRQLLVSDSDSLLLKEAGSQPLQYEVQSWLSERSSRKPADVVEIFSEQFQQKYLQLPELDPRIPELARRIAGHGSPRRQAEAIEQYLQTEYGYTLDLPVRRRVDPLAHFLFERREGHCEYFASAMTVMLRALNIPARLAAGFTGGVYNPISGLQVIRASDAHNWVEAYIPRYGWLTFDPTPPAPAGVTDRWVAQYWMYWDALQSAWARWIVDYDLNRQMTLAATVQEQSRQAAWNLFESINETKQWAEGLWERVASLGGESEAAWDRRQGAWTVLALFIFLLVFWFWLKPRLVLAYRSRRVAAGLGSVADCSFLYQRAIRVLERRGFARSPWQTAEEYAASIGPPGLRSLLTEINAAYNAARFGRDGAAERQLPGLIQALLEKAK